MIKRILVALSGTSYTPTAVRYALELAKLHGAEVTGVTLVDPGRLADVGPVPLGGGSAAHGLAEHRLQVTEQHIEEQIAAFESAAHEAGAVHTVLRETGDTLEELVSCWRYHDLTILGVRGLFDYGVLRDPDSRIASLIASGVRPILAVAEAHRPIRRVLIAYNGSMESAKAMKRFVQMRVWPGVELGIVCIGLDDEAAAALLDDAAAYCRAHGLEAEIESVPGDPREVLLRCAQIREADLLVLGTTGRSKISRLILGDTARQAMRHADIPLFLAR
jgi:nucleotide-binding universal stress UspA family protein